MSNTAEDDLQDILKFCHDSNIHFAESKLVVKPSKWGGLGVFTTIDLEPGEVLLRVPKDAVFSASNSSIANLLLEEEIDGMLGLNLAFIYETVVFGERSHWHRYLKSIKIQNSTGELYLPPSCWAENDKSQLRRTCLDTLYNALKPERDLRTGYKVAVDLAHKWNREAGLAIPSGVLEDVNDENQFLSFVASAYAVASRAFEIDNYHESALVPIADLFNHHVSTPDVRFESLYEVCPQCGEDGVCGHAMIDEDEEEEDAEGETAAQSDEELSSELIQELEKETCNLDSSRPNKETTIDGRTKFEDLDPNTCVDITLAKPVKKGTEVFNSYGDLSNALLVARYGFCVEDNPYDIVHLGPELEKFWKDTERKLGKRFQWWAEMGFELFHNWLSAMAEEDDDDDNSDEENDEGSMNSDLGSDEGLSDAESIAESDADSLPSIPKWQEECYIKHDGELSPYLSALITTLSMNSAKWAKLTKNSEDSEKMWPRMKALTTPLDKTARELMCNLLRIKRETYGTASAMLSNASARILVDSELHILERCAHRVKRA